MRLAELSERLAVLACGRSRLAVCVEFQDLASESADQIQLFTGSPVQPARQPRVFPFLDVLPIAVEDLHAPVLPVGDIHQALAIDDDRMRGVELAGPGAHAAPRLQQLAGAIE